MLNEEMIEEVTQGSHVGIMLNSYCDNAERIRNYVSKMRRGLMKIVGKGVRIPGLGVCCYSKTSLKLYESVVLWIAYKLVFKFTRIVSNINSMITYPATYV